MIPLIQYIYILRRLDIRTYQMTQIAYPTFTIPTSKCCSLILTFDDIAEILGDRRHIVQVGMGEIERTMHLIQMDLDWLFSPKGWPVYVSGFNPAIHDSKQVFQYELASKKIHFSSGTARTCMTHKAMLDMLVRVAKPAVELVALPCEEEDVDSHEPQDLGKTKVKRKTARRNQCFADALEVTKTADFKFVLPVIGSQQPIDIPSGLSNIAGWTAGARAFPTDATTGIRFAQIRHSDAASTLEAILAALDGGADVLETDFPFDLAKQGFLLNEKFELVDMKNPVMFNTNDPLLVFDAAPSLVLSAASHMRSYVHHLFRCEELSGPILLATVNLFQFDRLVSSYRM